MDQPDKTDKKENEKVPPSDEQMWSALSFAFLLIIIGLPLWWKTTEVPRVALPTDQVSKLSDLNLRINLTIHLAAIDNSRGLKLYEDLSKLFQHSRFYGITWKLHTVPKTLLGSCKTLEEIDQKVTHPRVDGNLQLMEIPGLSRFSPSPFFIGNDRTMYFSSEADAVTLYRALQDHLLLEDNLNATIQHINTPPLRNFDVNTERRVAPSFSYDILITIINPEPDLIKINFDIQKAIKDYLQPLLNSLSTLNKFHLKSQWLYFVDLDVKPSNFEDKFFILPNDRLSNIITLLEKRLGSHVSQNPCLNLVLWVPSCKYAPLKISSPDGQYVPGFLSPRWGGIQIYNPSKNDCNQTNTELYPEASVIMPIFIQQLRLLLGIKSVEDDIKNGWILENGPIIRIWEKDALLRSRTIEQLALARHTLQSLSYLLGVIANIVINEYVGLVIEDALKAMQLSEKALKSNALDMAHKYAKHAYLQADSAFKDPSLLQLLYFPEDQKYAVYIPLFLPVMIPVLISLKPLHGWALRRFFKKSKND